MRSTKSRRALYAGLLALGLHAAAARAQPATDLKTEAEVPVSGDWMGIGFGSLWEPSGGSVLRVDPATNAVAASIPLGSGGSTRGVGVGEGGIWVPNTGDSKLYRLDPATNQVTQSVSLPFSGSEGSIGVGAGSVWIATDESSPSRTLSRVDAKTGVVTSRIELPAAVAGVEYADGKVWLTSPQTGNVYAIDAGTGKLVAEIHVGDGPRFITSGAGAVWVLNQGDGNIVRVPFDQPSRTTVIKANLPGSGGDIHFGEGKVWASGFRVPVVEVDPRTNEVVARFEGSGMGDAVRAGLGSLWVSGTSLHRIKIPAPAPVGAQATLNPLNLFQGCP